MAFNKYYQDELAYLRDMGKEFSAAYPALAPLLGEKGGDPDVERLLEGFAFLTARIREKLDDELPELMMTVSQMLFPQMVRAVPAASILEFLPITGALREARTVARGTEVQSIAVDGTRCRFRTTADTNLAPIAIQQAVLRDLPAGRQELVLDLQLLQQGDLPRLLPRDLRLYFAGEQREAMDLLTHVLRSGTEVVLSDPNRGADASVSLHSSCLKAVGFEENEAMLPVTEATFPGFRLLQEYFVLPHKFCFLDICGFSEVVRLNPTDRIQVAVRLNERITSLRALQRDQLRLHCVPIVNVFETTADPIRVTLGRQKYLVRPAGLPVGHGQVYSIERVATVTKGGERVEISPFLSFEHAEERAEGQRTYYSEHRRSTVVGEGADCLISLGTAEDSGTLPEADVLSLDLLATNAGLANALRAGEICDPSSNSPPYAKFRNLTAPSTFVPPILGRDLEWRAMAHTALNLRALTEADVLRTVLSVYNLPGTVDRAAARAGELKTAAIREVSVRPTERLYRGGTIRGIAITLTVDESGFAGDGDLHLFGSVLERLFAEYITINSFSRLTLKGAASNLEYQWSARSGSQTLL